MNSSAACCAWQAHSMSAGCYNTAEADTVLSLAATPASEHMHRMAATLTDLQYVGICKHSLI